MSQTRQRLMDGALAAIRQHGIAGASARAIAAAAGVNQALVFYHFGSVHDLIGEACRQATQQRMAVYRDRLDKVTSLPELLDLGRVLHAEERELGNVTVLAQLLAGAQADQTLAEASAAGLQLWIDEIERVLRRLLAESPVAEVLDIPGLARAVSVGFVGMELYEAADADGAARAMEAVEQLGVLVEVVDDLGPLARRALRGRLRRAQR